MFPDFCNRRSVHVQSLSLCFDCLPCFDGRGTQIGRSPDANPPSGVVAMRISTLCADSCQNCIVFREGAIVPFLAGVSGILGAIGQASVSTIVPNWFLGNHIGFDTLIVATGRQLLRSTRWGEPAFCEGRCFAFRRPVALAFIRPWTAANCILGNWHGSCTCLVELRRWLQKSVGRA